MHQRIQFTQLKIVDHGAKATQCWLVYQGRLFIHQVCVYHNTEITQRRVVYQRPLFIHIRTVYQPQRFIQIVLVYQTSRVSPKSS
jgi:hypothetical protein